MKISKLDQWQCKFRDWLNVQGKSDPAHDLQHIERVVLSSKKLGTIEKADWNVLIPAAWLHDCVNIPKDSDNRSKASLFSADRAIEFLREIDYPNQFFNTIHHAILAHSFSAKITPESTEAKVLQDADRLDAIGAIGLSRCLMLGGFMGSKLYSTDDPFCKIRSPDDKKFVVDHFFAKLLTLEDSMRTEAGKFEARKRTEFLKKFLEALKSELP